MSEAIPLWMKITSAVHGARLKGHQATEITLSLDGWRELSGWFSPNEDPQILGLPITVNVNQPDPFVLTFTWVGVIPLRG